MFAVEDEMQMCQCPYNDAHHVLRKNYQKHILKCRLNYPNTELRTCPFNLNHLIKEEDYVNHVMNCRDKALILDCATATDVKKEEIVIRIEPLTFEENWDDNGFIDYDPKKYIEQKNVIREPCTILKKSEKKEFYKNERKRLGRGECDEDEEFKKNKTVGVYRYDRDTNYFEKIESKNETSKQRCSSSSQSSSLKRPRTVSPSKEVSGNYSRANNSNIHGRERDQNIDYNSTLNRGVTHNVSVDRPYNNYTRERSNYSHIHGKERQQRIDYNDRMNRGLMHNVSVDKPYNYTRERSNYSHIHGKEREQRIDYKDRMNRGIIQNVSLDKPYNNCNRERSNLAGHSQQSRKRSESPPSPPPPPPPPSLTRSDFPYTSYRNLNYETFSEHNEQYRNDSPPPPPSFHVPNLATHNTHNSVVRNKTFYAPSTSGYRGREHRFD